MPLLSRYFIKAGIISFIISLLIIMAMQARPIFQLWEGLLYFKPVFYHTLLVGWITQIIIGVSIWMFPRHTRENPRGSDSLGWLVFISLNLGLLLRIIGEPWQMMERAFFPKTLLAISAFLQVFAAIGYIFLIWPRVKGK